MTRKPRLAVVRRYRVEDDSRPPGCLDSGELHFPLRDGEKTKRNAVSFRLGGLERAFTQRCGPATFRGHGSYGLVSVRFGSLRFFVASRRVGRFRLVQHVLFLFHFQLHFVLMLDVLPFSFFATRVALVFFPRRTHAPLHPFFLVVPFPYSESHLVHGFFLLKPSSFLSWYVPRLFSPSSSHCSIPKSLPPPIFKSTKQIGILCSQEKRQTWELLLTLRVGRKDDPNGLESLACCPKFHLGRK